MHTMPLAWAPVWRASPPRADLDFFFDDPWTCPLGTRLECGKVDGGCVLCVYVYCTILYVYYTVCVCMCMCMYVCMYILSILDRGPTPCQRNSALPARCPFPCPAADEMRRARMPSQTDEGE